MARNYPNLCREMGSSDTGGPDAAVVQKLSPVKMREYEAVRKAIESAGSVPGNGCLRVKLVELVYFRGSHTLEGACQAIHISYATGRRYNHDFLCRIAQAFGLLE